MTTTQIRREAQIELFNRLWDASVGKSQDPVEVMTLLLHELNVLREELVLKEPT